MFMDFSLFGVNRAKDSRRPPHARGVTMGGASRPVLFHPDYTVGPGIQPGLLTSPVRRVQWDWTGRETGERSRATSPATRKRLPPVGNRTPPRERVPRKNRESGNEAYLIMIRAHAPDAPWACRASLSRIGHANGQAIRPLSHVFHIPTASSRVFDKPAYHLRTGSTCV